MTILSSAVAITCTMIKVRAAPAQSRPLRGLPAPALTCCPPSYLCSEAEAQERPVLIMSVPSPPLADLPFKFGLALGQMRHGRRGGGSRAG